MIKPPGLAEIGRLISSYRSAKVLFTAVELGIFEALEAESKKATDISSSLSLDRRAAEVLLDALAAMGFLEKNESLYGISESCREYLLKSSSKSLHHNLCYQNVLWQDWHQLPEIVKGGSPKGLLSLLNNPAFTEEYILAMTEIAGKPAREVAEILSSHAGRRVLDVGAGHGFYSLALLDRAPELEAVLLDVEPTLRVARDLWKGRPAAARVVFKKGDYHSADYGREEFDLLLLSHVTHDEGVTGNRNMLKKAFSALRSGGRVAIHDFIVSENGISPLFGALFSVHMLVYTKEGRTYRKGEYESWLRDAGFKQIQSHPICAGAENASVLLIGIKP